MNLLVTCLDLTNMGIYIKTDNKEIYMGIQSDRNWVTNFGQSVDGKSKRVIIHAWPDGWNDLTNSDKKLFIGDILSQLSKEYKIDLLEIFENSVKYSGVFPDKSFFISPLPIDNKDYSECSCYSAIVNAWAIAQKHIKETTNEQKI